MHVRGCAIESLECFARFADRVVPTLLDAFDSFKEYDPDYSCNGEHKRLCMVLETFGRAAAPTTARLTRYLEEWLERQDQDKVWPKDVFRVLEAIGPETVAALPVLWRLRAHNLDDLAGIPIDPNDPEDELERAILALQGY